MKKITLLLMLLNSIIINAQVASYTFSTHTGGTVASGGSLLGWQNEYYANSNENYLVNIGFTFFYNTGSYTQVYVNTNGFIRMGSYSSSGVNILNNNNATNVIAGFNTNMKAKARLQNYNFVTDGKVGYATEGTAPNRIFHVYWSKFTNAESDNTDYHINFEIRLYEGTNVIEFHYGNMKTLNGTAQVGLKGSNSSDFHVRTTTSNWASTEPSTTISSTCPISPTNVPANGTIFRFTPAAVTCDPPTDVIIDNILNTTAKLNWTNSFSNVSNNFQYKVQPQGTGVPTAAGTAVNNNNQVTMNNLTAETNYEVYLRKMCTLGVDGDWIGPFNFTTISDALSASDFVKNKLSVYPNPTENNITITAADQILTTTIYNLLGQKVNAKKHRDTTVELSLEQLNIGTYILEVETTNGVQTSRLIKK
ncbi:MAG: T9SS type A sorting domain-containing protein [Flavobacterium sp.]|nr:T9SS type A sorting domain-containing protein [Candidatus Neoflavobacterium equi]